MAPSRATTVSHYAQRQYLTEKVNPIMEAMVLAVIKVCPRNPLGFMLRWLLTQTTYDRGAYASVADTMQAQETDRELVRLRNEAAALRDRKRKLEASIQASLSAERMKLGLPDPPQLLPKELEKLCSAIRGAVYTGTGARGHQFDVLCSRLDTARNGVLTFKDLKLGLRRTLRIPPFVMSDAQMWALFFLVDESYSGSVSVSAFAKFVCTIGNKATSQELPKISSASMTSLASRAPSAPKGRARCRGMSRSASCGASKTWRSVSLNDVFPRRQASEVERGVAHPNPYIAGLPVGYLLAWENEREQTRQVAQAKAVLPRIPGSKQGELPMSKRPSDAGGSPSPNRTILPPLSKSREEDAARDGVDASADADPSPSGGAVKKVSEDDEADAEPTSEAEGADADGGPKRPAPFNPDEGFSDAKIVKLKMAFDRFCPPTDTSMDIADLPNLLRYLGHCLSSMEWIKPIIRQVSDFDYLDVYEYLDFMQKYVAWEYSHFKNMYEKHDEDGSGEMSATEVRGLMIDLNFIPRHSMIQESLAIVDRDGNGTLDFDELIWFLAVYAENEGFTRHEVEQLEESFNLFSEDSAEEGMLEAENISDAYIRVFGLGISDIAQKIQSKLASGRGLTMSDSAGAKGKAISINLHEFYVFGRTICEEHHANLMAKWKYGPDGTGIMPLADLKKYMQMEGYTPLRITMNEILEGVLGPEWASAEGVDFNQFFDYWITFQRREGFSKTEVKELKVTFSKFLADDANEIDVLTLSEMLRYMGYAATADQMHEHVRKVDKNQSGQLDFREFLLLMHLFREKQLGMIRSVHQLYAAKDTHLLPYNSIPVVLAELQNEMPQGTVLEAPQFLDFDDLVVVVDACRGEFVRKERKKAGFTEGEIDEFRSLFNLFDKDKSGDIDFKELLILLGHFGWSPKTTDEQKHLIKVLEDSVAQTLEAGIEEVGIRDAKGGFESITFWVFLRMARIFRTEQEGLEQERLQRLSEELKFSDEEIEQFRMIFRDCYMNEQMRVGGREGTSVAQWPEQLSYDSLVRLLRGLGLSFSPYDTKRLENKVAELDKFARRTDAKLDFGDFLIMMRWMMENDIAEISKISGR